MDTIQSKVKLSPYLDVRQQKTSEKKGSNYSHKTPLATINTISKDFEDIGDTTHKGEGRTITVEFNRFVMVACYVPNSGQGLKRLDYRIKQW